MFGLFATAQAAELKIGDKAPEFNLLNQAG